MSKSQSKIPSPARSQGAPVTPRRSRTRRTLSVASPTRSDASGRLSSVVEKLIKNVKFTMSPMKRRSVLPDNTEIEAPRRSSWWKRLEGSSREILEALDTNKMPDDFLVEEYEFEVEKDKEKTVSECSDSESVASIVVPQRRLFNQKRETQPKFGDIMGSRKSLGRTIIEDISIDDPPKSLFNKGPRNRPVFPAALLNSTNKTINKTVEPEPIKPNRPNLFGQAGNKRKNMFTDFVLSESEEDSDVQPKVFGFKMYDNKRMSLGTRNRRMPSLTPSITTEIDTDEWSLLPSSTRIGAEVTGIITDEDMNMDQIPNEDQDDTLTEDNVPLKHDKVNNSKLKTIRVSDENDKTLITENIENASNQEENNTPKKLNKTHDGSKTRQDSVKEDITKNTSTKPAKYDDEIIENAYEQEEQDICHRPSEHGTLIEDKMSELHGESNAKAKSHHETLTKSHNQEILNNGKSANTSDRAKYRGDQSVKDKSKQDIEPKADEQKSQNCSKKASSTNQDEGLEDVSEKDKSEVEIEPSTEDQSDDEDMEDISVKEKDNEESVACSQVHETQNSSKEISNENQDEGMEEMLWNDDEEQSEHDETHENAEAELKEDSEQILSDDNVDNDRNYQEPVSVSKNVTNKSQNIVESSEDHDQIKVVDETPNNSTKDKTGPNWNKESLVKSPEAVLQNMTKDNESFRPIGRSTSFRKTKSVLENINIRPSLAPVQESTLGSDGSRNSSTEGSGWDSHRTTRKTIRQTFGKDFTPRKSLRALVMEQSAKRQTEIYNRNASKLNITKNKTTIDDDDYRNTAIVNKPKNKTVLQYANENNASKINTIKNRTVLDDVDLIRDRRSSIHNSSGDQLPHSNSPAHESFAYHLSHPVTLIPTHKSVHDLIEPEMSEQQIYHREKSIDISIDNNDSGPEISINASYGQGMSRETTDHHEEETFGHKMSRGIKEISRRDASVRVKSSLVNDQEVLDYEASDHEKSEQEISAHGYEDNEETNQEFLDEAIKKQDENSEPEESENEVEAVESEVEECQQEDETEFEGVSEEENEPESEQEESQMEIADDSEQEESQQEMEAESEQEESHQEIEAESDQEESQQVIEVESEQEESEREENRDISHENAQSDLESVHDDSEEANGEHSDQDENNEEDSDHIIVSGLNSQYHMSNSNSTKRRIVFDNDISDQEIDYELSERVSRQITDNEISDQVSERETTSEVTRSKVSEHDVSKETSRSMLLMQMQKIAQQNMEIRLKMREKVAESLKPTSRNFNKMSPIQSKFPIRRINKSESRKPKAKPISKNIPMEALPKGFMEDLQYKPPKRYQPATASWITKRLYKYLETKLEPKYEYRARVRAEELVQTIHSFTKLVRRRDLAPQDAVDKLKREMARLRIVGTHFEFYEFFHEFMPREIRIKVNPDVVNKIPMPRNGIFSEILPTTGASE